MEKNNVRPVYKRILTKEAMKLDGHRRFKLQNQVQQTICTHSEEAQNIVIVQFKYDQPQYGLKDRKITGYFVMKDDRNQFYFENVGKNYQTAFIHMNVFSDSRVCLNDVLCNKQLGLKVVVQQIHNFISVCNIGSPAKTELMELFVKEKQKYHQVIKENRSLCPQWDY